MSNLIEDTLHEWKNHRCVGTAFVPMLFEDKTIVLSALEQIYEKHPQAYCLIIVDVFKQRTDLIEFLTHQENVDNNNEFKQLIETSKLRILTADFINKNLDTFGVPFVTIMYHCDTMYDNVLQFVSRCMFRLAIINKLPSNVEDINKLYHICPLMSCFQQAQIDALRTTTPIEEERIGVEIPEDTEEFKALEYYNQFIRTSFNIFEDMAKLNMARLGDNRNNLSSSQVCQKIARENGWDEHLDMSIELNRQIDELFNPISLKERADMTYTVIRKRQELLSKYNAKLNEVLTLINKHKDEKILVISKTHGFATEVANFVNQFSEKDICRAYHDRLEPIPAINSKGEPLYIQTGERKGERKIMAAKAQRTLAEILFNEKKINVISTNASPDKDIAIGVDVVIITSPLCLDIESYIYRLSNTRFNSNKLILYTLYVKNSLEETKLAEKLPTKTHTIVKNCENEVKIENNFDFAIVE